MADCKRKTANLFDYQTMAVGESDKYLLPDGSSVVSRGVWAITDYIPINGTTFTLVRSSGGNAPAICLYDDNKNYLTGIAYNGNMTVTVSSSSNAKFARFSYLISTVNPDNLGEAMLVEGSTAPSSYIPYGWLHSLRKLTTATDTITTLPADLYADGNNATVGLVGNMSQTGTPTPQNPIQPQECGDLTENLLDESILLNGFYDTEIYQYYPNDNYRCFTLLLPAGTYTIFAKSDVLTIRLLRVSSASLGANPINFDNQSYTFTLPVSETIYVSLRNSTTTNDFTGLTIMLNSGSTALPYEPHGYKLTISSANTTTPVYLGEVETTRKIKKLVFTGNEPWQGADTTASKYLSIILDFNKVSGVTCMSTHYSGANNVFPGDPIPNNSVCFNLERNTYVLYLKGSEPITLANFKTYLAQQYANGTPVTIWYVLATETTTTLNEPLRKIGDYADTVSGITIPTIIGKDTFDVLTTLKPSEVELTYTGWHDAVVKEFDGSD